MDYLSSDSVIDKKFDNYLTSFNNDKFFVLTAVTILAFYSGFLPDIIVYYGHDFISSPFFQMGIFIVICYIVPFSPALGISLALAVLVTLQALRQYNIENNMDGFSPMNPYNMNNHHEVYLSNPISKATTNVPTVDMKLVPVDNKYENMVKQGKMLLEDSNEIRNDLPAVPDIREKRIADVIETTGKRLVQSGINRLEGSDDGSIAQKSCSGKFIRYNKSMPVNNHDAIVKYGELKNNFDKLSSMNNGKNFEKQLRETQKNELEVLELIYKSKKNKFSKKVQEKITLLIDSLKESQSKNEPVEHKLSQLEDLLQ